MKTGWKIVLITAAIIAGIGVILGGISMLLGGSFQSLTESPVADTLSKISPAGLIQYITSVLG